MSRFSLVLVSIIALSCAHTTPVSSSKPTPASARGTASEDQLFWFSHPCGETKGVPFRKYQAFALDEAAGKIYARSSATAAPTEIRDKPPAGVAWNSVSEFFDAKGITKACLAAGVSSPQPSPSVEEPVTSVPVPAPSAPREGEEGRPRQSGSKKPKDYKPQIGNYQAPVNMNVSLYYQPLQNSVTRSSLRNFLSLPHVQKENSADQVVPSCPALDQGAVCVQQRTFTYRSVREVLFGDLDLRKGSDGRYEVYDVYCDRWLTADDIKPFLEREKQSGFALPGPGNIPPATILNVEHSWPQSKFPAKAGTALNLIQKTDLHHIYSTDNGVNGLHSNYDYAEVETQGSKTGKCSDARLGKPILIPGKVARTEAAAFEPPRAIKGDFARAQFYFSVRYNAGMSSLQEAYLRKWSAEDPPSQQEIERNNKVYLLMGTRNPFIDHPEWADSIDRFCREVSPGEETTSFDCQ